MVRLACLLAILSFGFAAAAEPGADQWPQLRGPGCRGVGTDNPRLPDRWTLTDGEPGRENLSWVREIPGRGW